MMIIVKIGIAKSSLPQHGWFQILAMTNLVGQKCCHIRKIQWPEYPHFLTHIGHIGFDCENPLEIFGLYNPIK